MAGRRTGRTARRTRRGSGRVLEPPDHRRPSGHRRAARWSSSRGRAVACDSTRESTDRRQAVVHVAEGERRPGQARAGHRVVLAIVEPVERSSGSLVELIGRDVGLAVTHRRRWPATSSRGPRPARPRGRDSGRRPASTNSPMRRPSSPSRNIDVAEVEVGVGARGLVVRRRGQRDLDLVVPARGRLVGLPVGEAARPHPPPRRGRSRSIGAPASPALARSGRVPRRPGRRHARTARRAAVRRSARSPSPASIAHRMAARRLAWSGSDPVEPSRVPRRVEVRERPPRRGRGRPRRGVAGPPSRDPSRPAASRANDRIVRSSRNAHPSRGAGHRAR